MAAKSPLPSQGQVRAASFLQVAPTELTRGNRTMLQTGRPSRASRIIEFADTPSEPQILHSNRDEHRIGVWHSSRYGLRFRYSNFEIHPLISPTIPPNTCLPTKRQAFFLCHAELVSASPKQGSGLWRSRNKFGMTQKERLSFHRRSTRACLQSPVGTTCL